MDLQTGIVTVIVALALIYLLRGWVRAWRGKGPICNCSGCPTQGTCTSERRKD